MTRLGSDGKGGPAPASSGLRPAAWRRLYAIVIAALAIETAILYAFTRFFS
jgi:hypothetical protein